MKKTSLYIEPEIDAALTRKAEGRGVSKAKLIRDALHAAAADAPRPPLIGVGALRGAPPDLSTNVDKYLAESGFGED